MNTIELELLVCNANNDESAVIKDLLSNVEVSTSQESRDPSVVLILGITANAIAIIASLLQIRDSLRKKKSDVVIIVRDIDMDELDLAAASDDQIKSFVENSIENQ